jgi:thiopurine S-methyltransferase
MNHDFWRARWREKRIGFHQPQPTDWLVEHHARIARPGSRVLVPLAGKSKDMAYLAAQGYEVAGIELVEQALHDFFAENGLEYTSENEHGHLKLAGERITCWAGDFFDFTASKIGRFDWIFDRAAMVVFPRKEQPRYVAHLRSLLERDARILLVTFCYDQREMEGPPFSVPEDAVRDCYANAQSIELLGVRDALDDRWRERGLTWAKEQAYLVQL